MGTLRGGGRGRTKKKRARKKTEITFAVWHSWQHTQGRPHVTQRGGSAPARERLSPPLSRYVERAACGLAAAFALGADAVLLGAALLLLTLIAVAGVAGAVDAAVLLGAAAFAAAVVVVVVAVSSALGVFPLPDGGGAIGWSFGAAVSAS